MVNRPPCEICKVEAGIIAAHLEAGKFTPVCWGCYEAEQDKRKRIFDRAAAMIREEAIAALRVSDSKEPA